MEPAFSLERRGLLQGGAALAGLAGASGLVPSPPGIEVSAAEFGAVSAPGRDNSRAIQAAIDAVHARGGGTVWIRDAYECGILLLADGVTLRGSGGWLVNGRIVVPEGRQQCAVDHLGIVDRRGDPGSFALDVAGRNCRFTDLTLVKDPIAGGYQAYIRQSAAHCDFEGLVLKGSNGIMVAGHDHRFERFELQSTMSARIGGDDAFAIKAPGTETYNIIIRNGRVRGFSAIASFGSEIGRDGAEGRVGGSVRNVAVSDVLAERCGGLCFFKPGALIYDWRDGLVEAVTLDRLTLTDTRGERFTSGVRMIAGREAVIRNVVGKKLKVLARASSVGVQPTAAIDIAILDGADGRIEDVDLEMDFADPAAGAAHGARRPGYPVDHIARIEAPGAGGSRIARVSLDVAGRGSRFGGIYIGAGLDNAVRLRRARLERVGMHPPASVGGGGIWSDSKVALGDIFIDSPVLPRFGGRGLAGRH